MSTVRPVAPAAARWITKTLEDAGFETWAVGGAVRDALLGRRYLGDWDFATRATPADVRRVFRRTVPIGVEHGTVGVLARDGTMFEVTTFRRDVETDGRHAVVEFADTIDEDLSRRDFTINAIAWHALREELCDPFDGAGDLARSILRTVGIAEERFREDYLRILRGMRFAGLFGLEIEDETWNAAAALVDHLRVLSPERVREELLKILGADPKPRRALDLYASSGARAVLYPELEPDDGPEAADTAWSEALEVVQQLPRGRAYLRLAALLRGRSPESVAALLLRLRLSNALIDEIARLASAAPLPEASATDARFRRWLSEHGPQYLAGVARLDLARAKAADARGTTGACQAVVESWRRARAIRADGPPLSVSDLAFDGRALIRMGLRPGPHFGEILDDLLAWVLDDPTRNEEGLLAERAAELAEQSDRSGNRQESRDG